jgi:hypothetical protein
MGHLYSNLMGFTTRRPADFPAIDRATLMRDAHQVARKARSHFANYHEALAYGLRTAWMSAKSRRQIQSLAIQAGRPAASSTSPS